jgi:hypothetical protein
MNEGQEYLLQGPLCADGDRGPGAGQRCTCDLEWVTVHPAVTKQGRKGHLR